MVKHYKPSKIKFIHQNSGEAELLDLGGEKVNKYKYTPINDAFCISPDLQIYAAQYHTAFYFKRKVESIIKIPGILKKENDQMS